MYRKSNLFRSAPARLTPWNLSSEVIAVLIIECTTSILDSGWFVPELCLDSSINLFSCGIIESMPETDWDNVAFQM